MEKTMMNNEINQIRSSVNIIDIVSGYIPLTPRGKNFFGICPFHDDHSPSMSVSKEKQIYTCFTCGATGNVFKFVMDYENVSFAEAVKIVASKAGISVDIPTKFINRKEDKCKELYEIYEMSQKLYRNNLNTTLGTKAREYLDTRGITIDIIKEFGIGLSLKKSTMLFDFLMKKKYNIGTILKTGLVNQNARGYYDMYYNRIMFPLWNLRGQVVGFSGRIYDMNDASKYINTKETELFKKGEILYNYHRARDEARQLDTIIIMEGFMDVIRAYTIGVRNVVATMGTAVTKTQALLIKRMAKNVILCFDGDKAGAKATLSCGEVLGQLELVPRVVRLEQDLDPDEYVLRFGKDAFIQKLENPINIMEFKLNHLKENRDLTNQSDYSTYIREVLTELTKEEDEILIGLTLQKVSEESHLDISFLQQQFALLKSKTPKGPVAIKRVEVVKRKNRYELAEQHLLYYMLLSSEVIDAYNKNHVYMPTEKYRMLAREICHFYNQNGFISGADLFTVLENSIVECVLKEILALSLKEEYSKEEIEDYIHVIYLYNVEEETKRLQKKLKQEVDAGKKALIAQKMVDLRLLKEKEMGNII